MKLIVGLGNPGKKYENTRHNFGFLVLDYLLKEFESIDKTYWEEEKFKKYMVKKLDIEGEQVLIAKPATFMNDSGYPVVALVSFYKILPSDIYVIHDDLDIIFGKIKVRFGGSSAGHKGVESIINKLGTDKFLRIRLGIGGELKIKSAKLKVQKGARDYVLSDFTGNEKGKLKTVLKETKKIVEKLISEGIEKYMSKYNKK